MQLTLINASNWSYIEDKDSISYISDTNATICSGFAKLKFDINTHKILCARDHFGQEPFYYTIYNGQFIFGSYIRDILRYLPETPKFSSQLIRDCFMRYPADDPLDDPPFQRETYYSGIFRITPGHYLHINKDEIYEEPFWLLDLQKPKIYYRDPRDYVMHFESLLNEAIEASLNKINHLALEFSGGIDSTMVFIASRNLNIHPTLFTHIPPLTRKPTAEDRNVINLINKYNLQFKHVAVDAEKFEPIAVFKKYSEVLSGPPPNLNCILSNNIHQAILQNGYKYVLSGYGGDDCVSFNFPLNKANSKEELYNYEFDILQGKYCHEIRMRLEYSSLVTKFLGLKYIYPLLYPPLVEYCFSLPFEQKFKNGMMRCTAREFLSKYVDNMDFNTKDGAVVPNTMQKCRDYMHMGKFSEHFTNLPFQNYIDTRVTDDDKLMLQIHAYMILNANLKTTTL